MKKMFALSVVTLVACGGSNEAEVADEAAELQRALANTVNQAALPAIVAFEDEVVQMAADVTSFCAAPAEMGLSILQAQWRSLAESWNHAALYSLGPLEQDPIFPLIDSVESMRPNGTDYTDTVRETLDEALASADTLDMAFFNALRFNEVGLLALEVLVFESSVDGSTSLANVLADYIATPRKCEYLDGMAQRLVRTAQAAEAGWVTSFE
ncbi:MAG: imelysin family protein, partial [Myxococcota bacterium]